MAVDSEPHVLIIGAGITGLLIAHGLQNAGIKYTIFETEESGRWRSKEWTMGLHWVLPLLSSLLPPDLAARVPTDGAVDASIDWEAPPNNGAMIYDGVDGKLLKDLTVPGRIVRVSRRKLRVLCQEGIDVNWGHTLDNISCNESDGTVTVTFTNGQKYNGTLLVGADGPRSLVRDYLFASSSYSAQAQPIDGVVNISMDVCYGDAEVAKLVRTAHPVWFLALSPEMCLFMSVQDVKSEKPETWRFFIFVSWLGEKDESLDSAGRMKLIKDKGAKFAEPFRTAILSIPEDTNAPYSDVGAWVAQPWDTHDGLVTLAGDSAHPMPPFRGQGGNHAIQDAYNYVEVVKKIAADPRNVELRARLIKEYSDEVAERGAKETLLSTQNGKMIISYKDAKESPYMKQGLNKGS